VFLTSKAENALKTGNPAAWEFMQRSLSPLSYSDKNAFANLLKTINYKLLQDLNPRADVEAMVKNDSRLEDRRLKQFRKEPWLATSKAKRRGAKTRKTT
jgi:hypothetical protein